MSSGLRIGSGVAVGTGVRRGVAVGAGVLVLVLVLVLVATGVLVSLTAVDTAVLAALVVTSGTAAWATEGVVGRTSSTTPARISIGPSTPPSTRPTGPG